MSQILDFRLGSHSKVIETGLGFIIMGQYYLKHDLSAVSLEGCTADNGTGTNMISIDRKMHLSDAVVNSTQRDDVFKIIKDEYIPDRYYFKVNGHYSNTNNDRSYLCVTHEKDNKITLLAKLSIAHIDWRNIIDQDENYVYVTGRDKRNEDSVFYRIHKTTFAIDQIELIDTYRKSFFEFVYKTDLYIYFYRKYHNGCTLVFYRYNKSNRTWNTWEIVYDAVDFNFSVNDNYYEYNNQKYIFFPGALGYSGNSGNNNHHVQLVTFNTLNGTASNSGINIKKEILNRYAGTYCIQRYWTIDNCICCVYYEESNNYPNDQIPKQGIHILKEDTKETRPIYRFDYYATDRISDKKEIISVCHTEDCKMLLVGFYQSAALYMWDYTNKKYISTSIEIQNILEIGFDELNRIWYLNTDGSVHMMNVTDPQNVTTRFENVCYTYIDEDIESYISLTATNYLGQPVSGIFELKLTGNAVFKETMKNTIKFEYSGGEYKNDIIITGPKSISCETTFIGVI